MNELIFNDTPARTTDRLLGVKKTGKESNKDIYWKNSATMTENYGMFL